MFTMTHYNLHTNTASQRSRQSSFLLLCYSERKNANGRWFWFSLLWDYILSRYLWRSLRLLGCSLRVVLCALGLWTGFSAITADQLLLHGYGQQAVQLFPWSVRIRGVVNGWR